MSVNKCFYVKLSPNKKSIFGLRMRSQILYLLLFASYLVTPSLADTETTCSAVKTYFEKKGILSAVDVQDEPTSDVGGLCLNQGCCTAGAKPLLLAQAKTQFKDSLRNELGKLADILSNRAKRFDDFFHKLLQLSREGFHNMFKRTYGMIYEQHSYVFEQLFEKLESYYSKGETGFEPMMDGFFGILYQKMFTVLNSQYTFDEKYLKCVNDHMRDYQPFEDMPHKLSVQLRRAFVATRTFHKALRGGASVLRNMMQVSITPDCIFAWARLRYCGACGGQQPPACSRYCHNVVRGCLPLHADLAPHWAAYVDAVEKVADRLLGPFNIAMVVEPLDIKISEAIMSFQDHNQEISQKIFADCGKPVLGGSGGTGPFFSPDRSRRSPRSIFDIDWNPDIGADDFELEASYESLVNDDPSLLGLRTPQAIRREAKEMQKQAELRESFLQYLKGHIDRNTYEELEGHEDHARKRRGADAEPSEDFYGFDNKPKKNKKPGNKNDDARGAEWGGPELTRLVRETRQRVRSAAQYWSHLPAVLCTSISVTSAPCFTGSAVASYTLPAAAEGSAALASNPEVRGSLPSALSNQQEALKMLTAKLKDAYNGVEVQWKDTDDLQVAGSSNFDFTDGGSGSGAGISDDEDDLPDDDEDRGTDFEGSGSGSAPPIDDDDEDSPRIELPSPSPPQTEEPFIPNIIGQPPTNNVNVRGRVSDPPADPAPPQEPPRNPEEQPPVADSAQRPSLQKALFTYALPVVCAWFGTIVTDLF